MKNMDSNKDLNLKEDELDLIEIFYALIQGKWIIISFTTFTSIIGVIYSLSLPNIYQSEAILVPVDPGSSISGALQNYSSLAGLAGISLPSEGSPKSNSKRALKTMTSLSFFKDNLMPEILLQDLMAVKSWDYKTNSLIYDESIFNENTKTWVRNYSYPKKQIPSAQESFKVFKSKHLIIEKDKITGFITLTVRHQSPHVAMNWANLIVNEINVFYRQKDEFESLQAVNFLNSQIATSSLSEVRQVIAELLKQETQKLALIEAKQAYVFDYIDPPAVMEKKSEPQRSTICIIIALLGGILSILIALVKYYFFSNKKT
jgi:LPS O-antigen subunit length determinant protein (WzzB/FepE family)